MPAADLDRIHPDLTRTLAMLAALPDRRDAVTALARNTQLAIGFRRSAPSTGPPSGFSPGTTTR